MNAQTTTPTAPRWEPLAPARPDSAIQQIESDRPLLAPALDIVVPVYNEQRALPRCIEQLTGYLRRWDGPSARVTIADNASTDATWPVARRLVATHAGLRAVRLPAKGRGLALKAVWLRSDAQVLAYMDVDLSTRLDALPGLVAPLLSGHSQLAIGTRLAPASRVVRGERREFISRGYNMMLRAALGARFSDAQCGFKAIRADAARELLPLVRDTGWFFDTEMLVLAQQAGLRIHEMPVDWVDDPDSRVDVASTAWEDLKGMGRVGLGLLRGRYPLRALHAQLVPPLRGTPAPRRGLGGQVLRFGVVGVASSLLQGVLYLGVRPFMGASAAAVVSLVLATFANTAANRTFTFGVRGRAGAWRSQVQGLALLLVTWALQTGGLALLDLLGPAPRIAEAAVVIGAGILGGAIRFVAMRQWMFTREVVR